MLLFGASQLIFQPLSGESDANEWGHATGHLAIAVGGGYLLLKSAYQIGR